MSYKVERLSGHWYDEGYRFATREEAEAYGASLPTMDPRRIKPSDDWANYRFKDGRLMPGAVEDLYLTAWEKMMRRGLI